MTTETETEPLVTNHAEAEQSPASKRLATYIEAQRTDLENVRQCEDTLKKLRDNIMVRTGRIDELRRVVQEE